jgi:hypothetical protein
MARNKTKGVDFFGWALMGWGVISALLGFIATMATIHYMGRKSPYPIGVDILFSLLAGLPYGLLLIIIGKGLTKLKSWARKLTLFVLVPFYCIIQPFRYFYFLGFNDVENIKEVIKVGSWPENMCPMLIPFLFGVTLLVYFTHLKVKEQFQIQQ